MTMTHEQIIAVCMIIGIVVIYTVVCAIFLFGNFIFGGYASDAFALDKHFQEEDDALYYEWKREREEREKTKEIDR